ncbi:MAG: chemotaxis protein CheR [Magnetococcales bacterium]|nr:chemotaxis protein CheR [Magnetococcales bacterium]MBF0421335.1 chemotaxis protein CheR [Magnetococcales bacterium]MBF0436072.1 chemotaxis protein CheR [Magnetococcales bacterium]
MAQDTPYMEPRFGLSDKDFNRLAKFIQSECGIQMPPSKKSLVTARLQKRLRLLKMDSFTEYVDWVLDPSAAGQELINFIDIITTNKTDFFREPGHFDYMTKEALPELLRRQQAGLRRPVQIWSAPCSTGEEPYTMAIVLLEFAANQRLTPYKAQILGTDLSTRALKHAQDAIYDMDRVATLPTAIKKKYMLRGRDPAKPKVRMGQELRQMVRFQHLNFMDATYNVTQTMDIIFCRNCLIYFDRPTTEAIVNKLCRHLAPEGYFFVGHSETLNNLKVPLVQVAPTIYQRPNKG